MGKKRRHSIKELSEDELSFGELEDEEHEEAQRSFSDLLGEYEKKNLLNPHNKFASCPKREPISEEKVAKKNKVGQYTFDLHNMSLDEAIFKLTTFIDQKRQQNIICHFKIITGKGLNSGPAGGVLSKEVYEYIRSHYKNKLLQIDPPPYKDKIDGIPLKGYFNVSLKC